jgi:L-asparaginase
MLNGKLEVPCDNYAIEKILASVDEEVNLAGVIYKDSLDMDSNDRKMLASIIKESKEKIFIIIHGTDTMDKTAEFLSEILEDRKIIITGAMKPFEIDNLEATFNLGMAIGYAKIVQKEGVYICMSGYVQPWDKIEKDREIGRFKIVK